MAQQAQETVVGRITSVFGVQGWLKVFSYTEPREGILGYRDWTLVLDGRRMSAEVLQGRQHGPGIVVQLKGITDRDQARLYSGADILVPVDQLAVLPEGEFYWHQLEGLRVDTVEGECLGQVHHLIETGSNDVLVVRPSEASVDQRERLLPYLPDQVIRKIDLESGLIIVDWDPEF